MVVSGLFKSPPSAQGKLVYCSVGDGVMVKSTGSGVTLAWDQMLVQPLTLGT